MNLRHSTLLKYIVSYILVLSVAFVGFYYAVQFHLQKEYKTVYRAETEDKIQNIAKVLDQSFTDILMMNYIIENDTTFIYARYFESSYYRYLAVSELKKLSMTNGLVKDILYFDIQNGDVLSANYSLFYKDEEYYLKTRAGDQHIPWQLISEKSSENTVFVLHTKSEPLYFFPAPKSSSKYRIMFLLNESKLYDLIDMYAAQEIGSVGILSRSSMVFSTGSDSFSALDALEELPRSVFLPDRDNSEIYVQDIGALQVSVIARIHTNYFSHYATEAFEKAYIIMAICLGIGILLIYFALKTTYFPLHDLVRRITKKDSVSGNEFLALGRAFDETLSEKEMLEAKNSYYKAMIKDAIRSASAASPAITDEQIERLFQEDFHGAVVVAVYVFSEQDEGARSNCFPNPKNWIIINLESFSKQCTVLVGISDFGKESAASVESYFQSVANACSCSVFYSDFSSNPMEIAKLYDMAKQAQRFSDGSRIRSYASVRQFCEGASSASYPYQIFDDLTICLRQLNFDRARKKINEIITTASAYPLIVVRCIYMDILALVNTSMHACFIRFDSYGALFTETLQLCRSAQIIESQNKIKHNIESILTIFESEAMSAGLQLPQVIRFVEDHCYEADFSLAYLANQFGVGAVYMSTFFTKRIKTTLTDYVWGLRLQRAKYLLETTDEPIDTISTMIGYEIPSSFRRKFKQEMGISPSEFRKQFRMEQNTLAGQ